LGQTSVGSFCLKKGKKLLGVLETPGEAGVALLGPGVAAEDKGVSPDSQGLGGSGVEELEPSGYSLLGVKKLVSAPNIISHYSFCL